MGKYTIKGSDDLDQLIGSNLTRIAEVASPHGSAGILLGGYGRGEGTPFINSDGSQAPFNDYDLVVVVDELNDSVRRTFLDLEQKLTAELGLPVDLYPYQRHRLPTCEFSLLNYEMKHGHKVIWGDEDILAAMPDYPHDAIPLSEGSRLLLNRGKLLLDIKQRLASPEPLNDDERIRFIKFIYKVWLALGDCALLAEGNYDISYRTKRERIQSIGDIPNRADVIAEYLAAIYLKEWGDYGPYADDDLRSRFTLTRIVFLEFFQWYRERYPNRECSIIKAILLNLKWNGRPLPQHPRTYLYDALQELLKDEPSEYRLREMMFTRDDATERFYAMQARFS